MKFLSALLLCLHGGAWAFAPHIPVSHRSVTTNKGTLVMKDYPKPNVENTDNYRLYNQLSKSFSTKLKAEPGEKKKVAIIGGGLSGLACAKYLVDAGHEPTVYEARDVLGGKVSAWQDKDGDWIETGLHIFFGAYPNMMNLFDELGIHDRLQWKIHQMIFAMQELPGEFTTFDFIPGIPAPFNFGLAILSNQKMLTLAEKIQTAPPLLPMLIEGQPFIDAQDELSVTEFMRKYGMPERINEEVFIAMAKALDFIDPDKLSMTVVLTAMNRFLNEDNGLQMAFLDGNQPDRLCAPMVDHIEARGGKVVMNAPVQEIVTESDGSIKHLLLRSGEKIVADEYVSAMPVDIVKRMTPQAWQNMPYFRQLDELEGIPVINLHMWFDRKLKAVDHLCFSRSPLLSVYADMSVTCKEYYDPEQSMLELVFAPCSPLAGGNTNWISKSDEEIIDATMGELARLFPTEIAADEKWPATKNQGPQGQARLRKYAVVKVPRSVYAAIPGRNKYRPSQRTPIPNLTMAGDWTSQKFLGSMEGAVLGGKLAAEVLAKKAKGMELPPIKDIQPHIVESAKSFEAKKPLGIKGEGAIAFGGGATLNKGNESLLREVDPAQFVQA
ncbi:phytoene dehydrogenase [Nitzschia inconspicua]|uniref:15-cis-phytoene desaturase, chloroplastic/chromoplastic n=1 Tax=Nitzschia inconspicua TaxID=303405 RepID=A0A9K3KQN8_9STRA|nr:phytoene dehydrogenase [Nitzschia inconspicua]